MRSVYGLDVESIAGAFRRFAGLPTVTLAEPSRVAHALDWFLAGHDFADALHLAASEGCEAFATFDRNLAKAAPDGWPVRLI